MKATTSKKSLLPLLVVALGLISWLPGGTAQQFSPPATEDNGVTSDLASLLHHTPARQQELFSNALRIIHGMESAPSCNRLAALTLINSCQSLEHAPEDVKTNSEMVLDEVKSEYAARLAVCELSGAKAIVPKECQTLVPSSRACVRYRFSSLFTRHDSSKDELCYSDVNHSQFERCLRALESKPQSWTSYSNARQNAVVVCQASRDAIEKDEKLALYKSLAEVTDSMTLILANSIQQAQTQLEEQAAFIQKLRASQVQAMRDAEVGRESTMSALNQINAEIWNLFKSFKDKHSQTGALVAAQSQRVHDSFDGLQFVLTENRERMAELFNELASTAARTSETHNRHLQLFQAAAKDTQQELDLIKTRHVSSLVDDINGMKENMHTTLHLVEVVIDRQIGMDEHLRSLNDTFDGLTQSADTIRDILDASAEAAQHVTGFKANTVLRISLILFSGGLWYANPRIAAYMTSAAGACGMLYALGKLYVADVHQRFVTFLPEDHSLSTTLIHHIASVRLKIPQSLTVVICLSLILLAAVLFCFWVDAFYLYRYHDDMGERATLPRVESPEIPGTPPPPYQHRYRFNLFMSLHV